MLFVGVAVCHLQYSKHLFGCGKSVGSIISQACCQVFCGRGFGEIIDISDFQFVDIPPVCIDIQLSLHFPYLIVNIRICLVECMEIFCLD